MATMFECSDHADRDIAFLCQTHDTLCCFDCISQYHAECNYALIRDLMKDNDSDQLCSRAVENVSDLKNNLECIIEFDKKEIDGLDSWISATKRKVHGLVENLSQKLKQLELATLRELDTKIKPIRQVYEVRIEANKQRSEETENIQYLLRKSIDEGAAFDKFIGVHRCSENMLRMTKELIESSTETKEAHLKFETDGTIDLFYNSIKSISSIGQLDTYYTEVDLGFKRPKSFGKVQIGLNDDKLDNYSQKIPEKILWSENLEEAILKQVDHIATNNSKDKMDSEIATGLSDRLKENRIHEIQRHVTNETQTEKGSSILQRLQHIRKASEEKHCTNNITDKEQKGKLCLEFSAKYSARHSSDKSTCKIESSTFLQDGRITIVDFDNNSIKLFDTSFQLVSSTTLGAAPTDVTTVSANTVAVTLPWRHKIQFVSVVENLQLSKCINTGRCMCYGITCSNSMLYATCHSCYAVHVYDMKGNQLKTTDTSADGKNLLTSCPYYIAVSSEANVVIVSCKEEIICFDLLSFSPEWRVVKSSAYDRLIALQGDGRLLVSGFADPYVLESDGSMGEVVFIGERGKHYKGINVDQTVILGVNIDCVIASKISFHR